jgi:predicted nucleotidyltransferase
MPKILHKGSEPALVERIGDALLRSGYPHAKDSIILAFEGGSVMHGASVGSDDHDYYAVYLEPPQTRLGLRPVEHHVWSTSDNTRKNTRDDVDLVMYSLTKFARLAAGGNPTILHFLFVENALGNNPWWEYVTARRQRFLARSHLRKFIGYADAQFDRLRGKRARKQFRPELLEKYGFDTKAAMHGIRLMYEALDLLRHGAMTFPNPHAAHLIAIRQGKYSLEEIVGQYEELKQECNRQQGRSPLAEQVDEQEINRVLANVYQSFWGRS